MWTSTKHPLFQELHHATYRNCFWVTLVVKVLLLLPVCSVTQGPSRSALFATLCTEWRGGVHDDSSCVFVSTSEMKGDQGLTRLLYLKLSVSDDCPAQPPLPPSSPTNR